MAEETLEQLMERFNEVSEEMQELKSIRRPRTGPPPAKYAALEKEFDELRDKIYPLMKDKPEWIKLMKKHDAATRIEDITKMGALEDVDVSKEQFEFTEEYDPEERYRELSKGSGYPADPDVPDGPQVSIEEYIKSAQVPGEPESSWHSTTRRGLVFPHYMSANSRRETRTQLDRLAREYLSLVNAPGGGLSPRMAEIEEEWENITRNTLYKKGASKKTGLPRREFGRLDWKGEPGARQDPDPISQLPVDPEPSPRTTDPLGWLDKYNPEIKEDISINTFRGTADASDPIKQDQKFNKALVFDEPINTRIMFLELVRQQDPAAVKYYNILQEAGVWDDWKSSELYIRSILKREGIDGVVYPAPEKYGGAETWDINNNQFAATEKSYAQDYTSAEGAIHETRTRTKAAIAHEEVVNDVIAEYIARISSTPPAGPEKPPKDWTKQRVGDLGAHSTERKEKWIKKFPDIVKILGGRDQAFQFLETHFNPGKGGKGLYFTILPGEGRGDAFIDFVDSIPDTHEWGGSRPYSVALIPDVNDPKKVNSEILYGRKDRVEAAGKLFDEPYKWKKLYEKQYGSEAINKFMEYYHRTPYVDYQLGKLLDYPEGKVRAYDQLNGYILDLLKADPTILKDELTPKAIKLFESNAPQSKLVKPPTSTIEQAAQARVGPKPSLPERVAGAPIGPYRVHGDAGVKGLQNIIDDLVDQYHIERLGYDTEKARLDDLINEGVAGNRLKLAQDAVEGRKQGLKRIFESMAAAIQAKPTAYSQLRNIPQQVKDVLINLMNQPPQRGAVSLEVLLDMLTGGSWRFANPQARKEMWRRFRGVINAWFSTGSSNVPASIVTETSVMDDLVETGNRIREDFGRLRGDLDPQVHQGYKLGSITPEERAITQEILKRLSVDEQFLNSMVDDPTPYLEAPSYETDRLATIEETGEIEAARSEEVHAQRQRRLDQQFERGHPDYPVTPYPEQQAALDAEEATRQARLKARGTMVRLPPTLEETVQLILHQGGGQPTVRSPIGMLYDVAKGPPTQELLDAFEAYTRTFVRRNAHEWHRGFNLKAMQEEIARRFRLARAAELGIRAVPDRSILPPDISPARGQLTEVPSVTIQDAADRTRLWNKYLELRKVNPEATMKEAAEALGIKKHPTPPPEEPIKYGSLSDEAVLERAAAEAKAKQPTPRAKEPTPKVIPPYLHPDPKSWKGGRQYITALKANAPHIAVGYGAGMVIEALIEAPGVLYEWNKRVQGETKDERLNRTLDYIYTRVPAVATFGYSDIIEALYTMSSAEDPAAASREYGKGFGQAIGIYPEEFPGGKEVHQDPGFKNPLGGFVSYDPTGDLPPGYLSLSDRPTSAEDIMEERLRQEQHLVGYEQPFSAEEQVQLLRGERLKAPPGFKERRRVIDRGPDPAVIEKIPKTPRPVYDILNLEDW